MISAIQNSPVNTLKPECKVAFGNKNDLFIKYGPKDFFSKSFPAHEKHVPQALPNTFEKFVNWLIGFKG